MSARFWQHWQQRDSNGAPPNGACDSGGSGSDGSDGVARWSSTTCGSVLAESSSAIAQAAALSTPQRVGSNGAAEAANSGGSDGNGTAITAMVSEDDKDEQFHNRNKQKGIA